MGPVFNRESVAVAMIIAALVIPTACARSSSAVATSPGSTSSPGPTVTPLPPNATYTGPILDPATVAAADVILDLPAARPKTSWQQAYDTCKSGDAVCDPKAAAVISLASATSPNTGQMSSTNSSIVPLMKRTLVYVITQVGVPCAPSGPPPGPGTKASTAPVYSCTFVNFVDAANGKVLYSTNGPTTSG